MTKKAGKFLQALRNIVNEYDVDLDSSEVFAAGAALLILLGLILYTLYSVAWS